jgi:hypothetical protein
VTATATPAAGWVFAGWAGGTNSSANPLSLAVNTNFLLTGTFAQLPAFDLQPVSVTNAAGSTVSFPSHAAGAAPLIYQWYFSSGSLMNATNATLVLTNVSPGQAGNYWIVATNNYGSATSHVASLTLTNVSGSTNVVYSADEASLRAAISIGGWVGLGFNGTITITNTINITNNVILDGSGVSAIISGGNAVRLFYVAPGASLFATNLTLANGSCIITNGAAGTPADAGAVYNDGGTVTLVSCLLTNNSAQSLVYSNGLARGGAIFNNGGSVSLFGSSLSNNEVVGGLVGGSDIDYSGMHAALGLGGAIFTTNGSFNIVNCVINNNSCQSAANPYNASASYGGALFQSSGSLNITHSLFATNLTLGGDGFYIGLQGTSPAPAYGGALATASGTVDIDHSQFIGNTAQAGSNGSGSSHAFGGAIYNTATINIESSAFSGNQALSGNNNLAAGSLSVYGGAIYNLGIAALNSCSIYSNCAKGGTSDNHYFVGWPGGDGLGGGIFNGSLLAATNCTIALNSAISGSGSPSLGPGYTAGINGNAIGGGVFNGASAIFTALNVTIASNSCVAQGAGFVGSNGVAAGTQIANTNGVLILHNSIITGTNSNAYGPITDAGFNISSDGSANLNSGASYNFTDPQLSPLANYGGPTLCMALLPDSPAIDNGDGLDFPATDQRGYVRPFGDGPDMGAYEYGSYLQGVVELNITSATNNVLLTYITSLPGSYRLQASTNLTSWVDLTTNGPFASATNLSQTVSQQGLNLRFFRLLVQ